MSRAQATSIATAEEVLEYWFGEPARDVPEMLAKARRWFGGGPEIDAEITARFGATIDAAMAGTLDSWASTPRGRLALILLLDQMTRNRFRNTARMYAGDAKAQALTLAGVAAGELEGLRHEERGFFVVPLLHAESLALLRRHRQLVADLFRDAPMPFACVEPAAVEQSEKYNAIIERFGRFPHRNAILGRESTAAEEAFLVGWADRAPPQAMKRLG